MRIGYAAFILAWVCTTRLSVQAQEPLIPLWLHIDNFGAGSVYPSIDDLSTNLAFDHGTDRIYRSIRLATQWSAYSLQVFDTEGNNLTPSPQSVIQGMPETSDALFTKITRLTARNDTIAAIVRFVSLYTPDHSGYYNWLKVLGTDAGHNLLLGTGPTAMNDYHHDAISTLVLTENKLRRYGPTGWPNGSVSTPDAEGMAVLGNDVVLGAPPSITRINRNSMTTLSPIAVPTSGSTAPGICIANGTTAFNYAALHSNGIMDVGLADINSGPIWNTTISIPAEAKPTAYHVDEQGDLWIAVAHNATGLATLGLLYRFHYAGGPYGVNSFNRRIDGITSNDGRLFLTGRQAGSTSDTYLAAFETDLITSIAVDGAVQMSVSPNPTKDLLGIRSIPQGAERLHVMDATGRTLKTLSGPFDTTLNFSVADLAPGAYFVRIDGRAGSSTLPFQVSR